MDRPDIDRQDLEDVRGLLRRESTRGKRKISHDSEGYHPSVPTINEPEVEQPGYYSGAGYGPPNTTSYENQRPGYSTVPSPYRPQVVSHAQSSYLPQQTQSQVGQAVEMSQMLPARTTSNPYRSDSRNRQGLQRPGQAEEENDEWNLRPYSGV